MDQQGSTSKGRVDNQLKKGAGITEGAGIREGAGLILGLWVITRVEEQQRIGLES
jgi:hypothetical protein